jgi:hypothetical protein
LQGRVLRIVFQQGELFISPRADVGGQELFSIQDAPRDLPLTEAVPQRPTIVRS